LLLFEEELELLLITAVSTLSFLVCVGVLLPDELSLEGFLIFSDLTEVSSTEDDELLSLTFLVPLPPDEDTTFSLSISDVCRLKSADGVDD